VMLASLIIMENLAVFVKSVKKTQDVMLESMEPGIVFVLRDLWE